MTDSITRSGSGYSAPRDSNRVPVTFGVSTVDGITPVPIEVNPSTGQLQTSGSGGGGGGAVTIADGADVAEGATTDAAVAAGSTGSVSGKLRQISADISTSNTLMATAANQTTMNSNLTSIVTNTAAGATSANQTNGTQQTKLTDGTNVANVLAATSVSNARTAQGATLIGGAYQEMTGTAVSSNAATIIASTDVSNYKSFSMQLTGTWSSTVQFQGCNDNATWLPVPIRSAVGNANGQYGESGSVTGTGLFFGTFAYRYFRVISSSYVSGTINGIAELYTQAYAGTTPYVTVEQQSGQTFSVVSGNATGTAVPANAFYIGGSLGGNLAAPIMTSVSSDGSALGNALYTAAIGYAYNGSTLDRVRTTNAASNTTGTGLLGAGILGYDGTNYQRIGVDAAKNITTVQYSTTATLTNIAGSATTVSLLASNAAAKSRIIYNDSTAILYVKYGTTASTTSYTVQIGANGYFEFPQPTYTGAVDGIWASANGNARITEVV